mgnify:FL=1
MNTVLLVYILTSTQHMVGYPKFFTMYRTEAECTRSAKKYMEQNGKSTFLVNAVCADANNPSLVPYLHDVPEVSSTEEDI